VDCSKPGVQVLTTTQAPASTSSTQTSTTTTTTTTTTSTTAEEHSFGNETFIGNGTFDAVEATLEELPENVTDITVEDTLKFSELTKLDVNKTSDEEIKQAFCREIGAISSRYEVVHYTILCYAYLILWYLRV
jgi:hypothetical protein